VSEQQAQNPSEKRTERSAEEVQRKQATAQSVFDVQEQESPYRKNLETISRKQRNDLEQQVRQLLATMRKAKLENDSLVEALKQMEHDLEQIRRTSFDATNPELLLF
jgi:hypothetical protein